MEKQEGGRVTCGSPSCWLCSQRAGIVPVLGLSIHKVSLHETHILEIIFVLPGEELVESR